ncbi:MAG: carboxy-S-adenosyl-L-methionine synthase CmoA [Candidatus Binatia bacterium]
MSNGDEHDRSRQRDALYAVPQALVTDFTFGEDTSRVFDDMLHRSVPYYDEIQRMLSELAADFAVDGTNVYDLGCSTGATLRELSRIDKDVQLVGVDSSPDMLERAREQLLRDGFGKHFELQQQDLHQGLVIDNASVVVMCLTLQFVRPLHRERVVRTIYDGLTAQGCLLLVEKVLEDDSRINRLFIKHYHEFKRRHAYSEMEIAQKREALENVLIPYRLQENLDLLTSVGFRPPEVFFKWYNFCGIVAVR